jgi:photosystem II stability/assembly factor-like uncharacterized protein
MKKSILLLLLFALCPSPYALSQQYGWTDIFRNMPDTPTDTIYISGEPYFNSFTDLFFISDDEGWVTSLQQNDEQEFLIFHTQDGGLTWEIQTTWDYCQAIWMLDSENGYAGDHGGFIFVTHNGGETWDYHGATGSAVTDMSFAPGSDTGFVCNDESYYFWKITPGGVTQYDLGGMNFWSGISATDEKVWICGGIDVLYYDLATQVLVQQLVQHCLYFGPVFFIDKDHGWIGNDCYVKGFTDYNQDWPVIFTSNEDAVTCIHAIDTNQVWATLWDGRIIHTNNGSDFGLDAVSHLPWTDVIWETQPHPGEGNLLNAIQFTSPNSGYACGENNILLKYTQVSSVEELPETGFVIFPNPTTGQFRVMSDELRVGVNQFRVEIVDLFGKVVRDEETRRPGEGETGGHGDREMIFDISGLPAGVYFVRIYCDGKIFVEKVVKY